jgi:hypothetical protein
MKKIATTEAASQPSVQRRIAARKPSPKHEEIISAIAARAELIPDFTDLIDGAQERALVEAFIAHRVDEDVQKEIRLLLGDEDHTEKVLTNALPDNLQPVCRRLFNHLSTMRWIHEEIVYALGVEVGRRLSGGMR